MESERQSKHQDHSPIHETGTAVPANQKDLFAIIAERTSDGITIIQDFKLVFINPGLAQMLGYTGEEMINTRFLNYIHPNDRDRAKEIYARRLAGETVPAKHELALVDKKGKMVEVEINAGIITFHGRPADFVFIHDISHLKLAERRIRESEELYRNIFELAPDGIATIDAKGVVTSCNQSFLQLSGFTQSEIIGKHFTKLPTLRAKDFPRYVKLFRLLLKGEIPKPIEFEWTNKDGTHRWGEAHITLVRQGNRTAGLQAIVRDITERRRGDVLIRALNQAALAMSEVSTTGEIFNAAAKILKKLGFTSMVLLLNESRDRLFLRHVAYPPSALKAAEKLTGLKQSDYSFPVGNVDVYKRIIEEKDTVFIDDTPPVMRQILPKSLSNMVEQLIKILKIHKAIAAPLLVGEEGFGILCVQSDELTIEAIPTITAFAHQMAATWRKAQALEQAQQEVSERRRAMEEIATLLAAIEQAEEMILVTDLELKIVYVNPAFQRITGYTRKEAIGQNIRMLKSFTHEQTVYEELVATLRSGNSWRGRLIDKKKDGSFVELETTISPVRDLSGKNIGRVSVQRDITEQSHLEAQLRQAQKMEAVGKLTGGIAHDFNNLLTTILGYADLVLYDSSLDIKIRESINEVRKSAERASSLTQQLLAYSRQQILQPKIINLNETINNLQNMLVRLIGEDIILKVELSPDLGLIKTDPGQIEQVVMNLAINARDAMPKGGVLEIQTANTQLDDTYHSEHPEVPSGDYVLLSVRDNGHGMSEAVKSKIFDPFFTTKKIGDGTGLGLSTVYGIVKQSGGCIEVESVPGQGTAFIIYLPIDESEKPQKKTKVSERQHPKGSERILLVEDETALRDLIAMILRRAGYSVITAIEGKDALSKTANQEEAGFDLLITDVIMPEMSGKELSERISALYPAAKTLYISGYTDDKIAQHGVLEEGVTFLQKPFSPAALTEKVQEVLKGR